MACEFYWISGSPFAWRVHLALEHKCIPYHSRLLVASEGEHLTPEFLKLNPRGRVPVLQDGDIVIYESIAILAYLDARYPDARLLGATPSETGQIWQRIHEIENYARNPMLQAAIAILNAELVTNPVKTGQLVDLCREQLDWMETILSGSKWMVGQAVSAADFVLFPVLMIFLRSTGKTVAEPLALGAASIAKHWPNIDRWLSEIKTMRGFSNTYPPHW